ncbi:MAG: hypothetical protein AAF602_00315 [Myxococcota bacterium]
MTEPRPHLLAELARLAVEQPLVTRIGRVHDFAALPRALAEAAAGGTAGRVVVVVR